MEENMSTASQKSPASREVSDEVADTVGGSSATDSETITAKRKRDRPTEDETHDHADVKSSPVSLPPGISDNSSMKRPVGRPKGSGRLQVLATIGGYFAATAGGNFDPYVMTIKPGEDMVRTIMSFATMTKRAVCILAATGVVSKVMLHIPGSSNAPLVHEGSYHIITLSGSYRYHKVGNKLNMMGKLSILMAAPDGQLFGGPVAGSIVAGEPIQLIIASFKQNVMSDFLKRKHSSSAVARDSETNRPKIGPDNENFTTQENAPLEEARKEAEPLIAGNENTSPATPHSVDENALPLQVWQPIYWGCNQKTYGDTIASVNENWSPASP